MECSVAEKMLTFPSHLSPEALLVRDALVARGLETPMVPTGLSRDEKYRRITAAFTDITRTLGLDLNDDSLCETPHRIAKMYVDEIFSGLDYAKFPKITAIANKMRVEEMVQVAFSQRRKLLRHTLGRWMEAEGLDLPFDLQRRAEEVPVAEYLALARAKAA